MATFPRQQIRSAFAGRHRRSSTPHRRLTLHLRLLDLSHVPSVERSVEPVVLTLRALGTTASALVGCCGQRRRRDAFPPADRLGVFECSARDRVERPRRQAWAGRWDRGRKRGWGDGERGRGRRRMCRRGRGRGHWRRRRRGRRRGCEHGSNCGAASFSAHAHEWPPPPRPLRCGRGDGQHRQRAATLPLPRPLRCWAGNCCL